MNKQDDIKFQIASLNELDDAKLDNIISKVMQSEKGASSFKSMMRSVMRSALKSTIRSVAKSPAK